MRRDRKIKMAISDSEYVKSYLTIDLEDETTSKSLLAKKILEDKKEFKEQMAQNLSNLKLDVINAVIKRKHPIKAGMLDPTIYGKKT